MKTFLRVIRLLAALAVMTLVFGAPQPAETAVQTVVAISPQTSYTCTSGQIAVRVQDGVDLVGYEIRLGFTPGIISITGTENGTILPTGFLSPSNSIDNTLGTVVFGNVIIGQDSHTGDGDLFIIYFNVIQSDKTVSFNIDPANSSLVDTTYGSVPVVFSVSNGTLTTSCTPPEHFIFLPLIRR